ncbi:MAG: 6-phosphofructokinase, partial [Nitrospirota bacterium]
MDSPSTKFAILVGGGPAPGINSVIEAATIRSRLRGVDVLGIEDGFQWLMKGDLSHTQPLTRETVSHLHFRGGSLLRTSRANPTKRPQDLSTTLTSLQKLDVTGLITIGGD